MNPRPAPTRVAVTGAAGFLGRFLATELASHFPLRVLDIEPAQGPWEQIIGSAGQLELALELCAGCSDLVIAHMAPNRPTIYETPPRPFEANVTGTANLFHAASVHGLRRVILISSTSVVEGHKEAGAFLARDLPPLPINLYGLTKTMQESIAEYYHRQNGLEVAAFRPAHICDEESRFDKYGRQYFHSSWTMIDPRDIAEGVRLALLAPKLEYEVFYILGAGDSGRHADMDHIRNVLGWSPRHAFRDIEEKVS